jgi:hypothetical protein
VAWENPRPFSLFSFPAHRIAKFSASRTRIILGANSAIGTAIRLVLGLLNVKVRGDPIMPSKVTHVFSNIMNILKTLNGFKQKIFAQPFFGR